MKQRSYGFSVLAVVLAALALSGPVSAGEQVPFKGESSGVVTTVDVDPVAGVVKTRLDGEGHATHLGRFTVTGEGTIDLATGRVTGPFTLTAANGDMLLVELEGAGSTQRMG